VEIHDYIRLARKRWWWMVIGLLSALGIAAVITAQMVPEYGTSVTFFITTPNTGGSDVYQGGLFSQQRVKSYQKLLTGDRLARLIAAQPGLRLDPAQIRERISAQAVPETVLLEATVTDSLRNRSLMVATRLATQFKILVESLETPPGKQVSSIKVEVVAGPETADLPVSPRPFRNLAYAGLVGLLAGAGAAVLREVLDTTVKNAEALEGLAAAPVLAAVPFDTGMKSDTLSVSSVGRSARAEALRQLRTNLQYMNVDRPIKTLVVTSAVAGEGKSSTACGLAMLLAEAGYRVLIVDADLRAPRIADYLGLPGDVGLTTVLANQAPVGDAIQQYGDHLWVLPSGVLPANPSELLCSQQMTDLLRELREQFDTVIVDCPALLPVTDAAVVAAMADGALVLARSRRTTSAQVTAAVKALHSVDARLLGCVLNMVPARGQDAYYYEYPGRRSSGAQLLTAGEGREEARVGAR
jgi:capsular exopolysaccharide synthesis family protein